MKSLRFLLFIAVFGVGSVFALEVIGSTTGCAAPVENLADSNPLPLAEIDPSQTRIVIHKSDYQLKLYEKGNLLKTYPVVFGSNPVDDKKMQGDACTPEGTFKIRAMYDHKSWTKFM
ncbi:MAG: L,D-transpeptidase, partial [Bacteroidota bacterium]